MPDPITRLEFAVAEVDRVFGVGHAATHSDLVAAVLLAVSIDGAAMTIAAALLEEPADEIVPIRRTLLR